jgi:hypothetical protein
MVYIEKSDCDDTDATGKNHIQGITWIINVFLESGVKSSRDLACEVACGVIQASEPPYFNNGKNYVTSYGGWF